MTDIISAAASIFLPYFTPIIFILLAVNVADRLRETITNAITLKGAGRRTS